jgi:hypothetical protein
MNTPSNINWTQLAILAMSLFGFFGIHITGTQQAAITNALPQIVTGVTSLVAIATMLIHTFYNHGADGPIAKAIQNGFNKGYDAAKGSIPRSSIVPCLFALLLVPMFLLGGCGTLGGSSTSGDIGNSLTIVSGVQTTYLGLCPAGSNVSYCVSSRSGAKSASAIVALTASQLVSAYEAGGSVTTLEQQLLTDITQWDALLNDLNAKSGKKKDIATDVVTILGVLIPVGTDIYNAIQEASGNYTNSQLNALVATIQSQNNQIQAL